MNTRNPLLRNSRTTAPESDSGSARVGHKPWRIVSLMIALNEINYLLTLSIARNNGLLTSYNPVWLTGTVICLVGVQGAALIWRNTFPLAVFWFDYALHIVALALQGDSLTNAAPSVWFALFFLAAQLNVRKTVATVVVAATTDLMIWYLDLDQAQQLLGQSYGNSAELTILVLVLKTIMAYLSCALLGAWVGWQHRRTAMVVEHTGLLKVQSQYRVREALAAERNRMARELHDLAAHQMSAIAIQSRAAMLVHPEDGPTRSHRRWGGTNLTPCPAGVAVVLCCWKRCAGWISWIPGSQPVVRQWPRSAEAVEAARFGSLGTWDQVIGRSTGADRSLVSPAWKLGR